MKIALNTQFGLPSCSYLLDLGAKMIDCCSEGCVNYLKLFGLWRKIIVQKHHSFFFIRGP